MQGADFDAGYVPLEGRLPQTMFVLGLVVEWPSHGYEIAQRYEARFGWLLPISSSSVYGALERLRGDGLLKELAEDEPLADARSRGRRRMRATPTGARMYRAWLAERMRDDPQRFELLGKLISAAALGVRGALDVLDRFERECVQELKGLPLLDERLGTGECDAGELGQWLAVDRRRRALRTDLDWAADARKTVQLYGERRGQAGECL